jgi:hypothetical protein
MSVCVVDPDMEQYVFRAFRIRISHYFVRIRIYLDLDWDPYLDLDPDSSFNKQKS